MRSVRPSMNAVLTEPVGLSIAYGDWSVAFGVIKVLLPYYFLFGAVFGRVFLTVFNVF